MCDERMRSDKVMLPESLMGDPAELRRWIAKAFRAASALPKKDKKVASGAKGKERGGAARKAAGKRVRLHRDEHVAL
jgi:hypothetical protein